MAVVMDEMPVPGGLLRIRACGEAATLVEVLTDDLEMSWREVHGIAVIGDAPGFFGAVATYTSVLIEYDPVIHDFSEVVGLIRSRVAAGRSYEPKPGRRVIVPVVYGGKWGPDLEAVADELELSPDELIRRHHERPLLIRAVVSPAGSPMSDGPDLPAPVQRQNSPRPSVLAGSVALAGRQAITYATSSPGGWRLIGRTPVQLINPYHSPPVIYRPGDLVQYLPIAADRWDEFLNVPVELRD